MPPNVSCVRILAAGSRSVTSDFDVTPGSSALLVVDNLPIGNVTFSAFAFAAPCAMAHGIQPTWSAPATAAVISAGQQTNFTLRLTQVGSAGIDIEFDGDKDGGTGSVADLSVPDDMAVPLCLPPGKPCLTDAQCCSNLCSSLFGCSI